MCVLTCTFRASCYSRYRDANLVSISPLDDDIATAPSGPGNMFHPDSGLLLPRRGGGVGGVGEGWLFPLLD